MGEALGDVAAGLAGYVAELLNFVTAEAEARQTATGTRRSRRDDVSSRAGSVELGSLFGRSAADELGERFNDIIFGDAVQTRRGTRRRQLFDPSEFDPEIADIGSRLDAFLGDTAELEAAAAKVGGAVAEVADSFGGVLTPLELATAANVELAALESQRAEDTANLIGLIGEEVSLNDARTAAAQEWLATLRPALTAQQEYIRDIERLQQIFASGDISADQLGQGTADLGRILNERLTAELEASIEETGFGNLGDLAAENLSEALANGIYGEDWGDVAKALISSLTLEFASGLSDAAVSQGRRLLGFRDGGFVPGTGAAGVPIEAHPGELILNIAMQRNLAEGLAALGGPRVVQQFLIADATATTRREIVRGAPALMNAFASDFGNRAAW